MNLSKNAKIYIAVGISLLFLTVLLVVWGISLLIPPVMELLGFDLTDYEGEEIIKELSCDSDEAKMITDTLSLLLYSPSPKIVEFDGADEVALLYTDSVLSYIMNKNYSKYVCNLELLSLASDSYANYNFRTIIPATDFRAELYRAFGGSHAVREKSGDAFKYHEKIDSFSLVGTPHSLSAHIEPISFGETEHSYKMSFSLVGEKDVSDEYLATCIKRDDGTLYIKSIKKLAS